ncbi:hypothetical protein CsSME_00028135 [Camellia sinensis var. sinensis]|uniref:uncharacterized protein LOC114322764 n=1 Tax=Camellia sinensis TaxID=4442 RepID=UPI0010357777|nr:uncharacterized protein LOC114322764 [Camellia sinensis]
MGEITHFSHRHPLVLSSDQIKDEVCCFGCRQTIKSRVQAYVCATAPADCKYMIHKSCAKVPQQIYNHPFHPQHPLTLSKPPYHHYGKLYYYGCYTICSGFMFRCSQCDGTTLDINCASLSLKLEENQIQDQEKQIEYFSHKHPLIPFTFTDHDKEGKLSNITCRCCYQPIIKGLTCVCFSCKFFIHKSCAELPQQIQHPFHPQHSSPLLPQKEVGKDLNVIGAGENSMDSPISVLILRNAEEEEGDLS